MKLTSELLTGAYEETEELRRLDIVQQNHDAFAELQALAQQISGAMSMLDDLYVAKSSLEAAGYSTEWMDCINTDNNFMMVVHPDLSNFFGGDDTKQAACEGAILDTIKRWADKVWEWLKALYAKIVGVLKSFIALWVHNPADTRKITATLEKCQRFLANNEVARQEFAKCFSGIVLRDPLVLDHYLDSYAYLNTVINLNVNKAIGSVVPSGNVTDDAIAKARAQVASVEDGLRNMVEMHRSFEECGGNMASFVVRLWEEAVRNDVRASKISRGLPTIENNGFEFTASKAHKPSNASAGATICEGIVIERVFTDTDRIPKRELDASDPEGACQIVRKYIETADTVSKKARLQVDRMKNLSAETQKLLGDVKKRRDQYLASPNIASDSSLVESHNVALRALASFSNIFLRLSGTCTAIANGLDTTARQVRTRLSQFENAMAESQNK